MMPEFRLSQLAPGKPEGATFSLYKFAANPSRKGHWRNPNIPA
jgi:hypothetical protein